MAAKPSHERDTPSPSSRKRIAMPTITSADGSPVHPLHFTIDSASNKEITVKSIEMIRQAFVPGDIEISHVLAAVVTSREATDDVGVVLFGKNEHKLCSSISDDMWSRGMIIHIALISLETWVDELVVFLTPHGLQAPHHWMTSAEQVLIPRWKHFLIVNQRASYDDVDRRVRGLFLAAVAPLLGIRGDGSTKLVYWATK